MPPECQNLIRQPGGYYRCSLPAGHLTACVPDAAHLAHDEEMATQIVTHFVELARNRTLCDATVPSYWNDEVRHSCGHEATSEALWIDGQWHPRCQRHVDGYPTNRVRGLSDAT